MFIKDKTKVACRMSGIERRIVYFRKLLFETDNDKFSLRGVKSKKISRHQGGNLLQSRLYHCILRVKVGSFDASNLANCLKRLLLIVLC